ncbi:MAG: thiamine phosphate synthase, partial [Christensenella sp.]
EEALRIKELCRAYQVPFVINDSVEIAILSDADGVHVGQSDMKTEVVRQKLGEHKIIGVSVQTVEQAMAAELQGANYLGVGAVFPTATKSDAAEVAYDTLQRICAAVEIPVIAIGGITEENIPVLKGSGICGIALVSALFGRSDTKKAAQILRGRVEEELLL